MSVRQGRAGARRNGRSAFPRQAHAQGSKKLAPALKATVHSSLLQDCLNVGHGWMVPKDRNQTPPHWEPKLGEVSMSHQAVEI